MAGTVNLGKSPLYLGVFYFSYSTIFRFVYFCLPLLVLVAASADGQQCTGYVLYREDFGSKAEDGGPLPAGVTTYQYTTAVPVEDGYYGIRKVVSGHNGTWFHPTDHSGNGYMMVVNASYTPGLFYQARIDNLCQGSSFYFSAWVANLMMKSASGPLDPNLKFVIRKASDSSVITSIETGTLKRYSSLSWEQYGINFSLPSGESSVILQIFNHAGGGNGNDLVLDDITFSICGPAIQVDQSGLYKNTHDVCEGKVVTFTASVDNNFYSSPEFLWQFGTDTLQWQDIAGAGTTTLRLNDVNVNESGWYRLLVSEHGNIQSAHCRIASQPVPVNVKPQVKVDILANSPVCEGNTLVLEPSHEALSYQWEGPGGFKSTDPSPAFENASLAQQGQYSLMAVTGGGCTSNSTADVTVVHNDLKVALKDSVLCEGKTITLDALNAGATYSWNTGAKTASITTGQGGFYKVIVTKGSCQAEDSISVRRILLPHVELGADTAVCIGEHYALNAAYPDVAQYLWQDGTDSAYHNIDHSGLYQVTLSNTCGTASDMIRVTMEQCADRLVFPTAFTPNGDGVNDYFRPRLFLRVNGYEMKVYDRWGQLVYQGKDPDEGWDGSFKGNKLSTGTYVWMCRYVRQRDHFPVAQEGTITLIR